METEFAGCLLMVGPPDVIGSGETEARRLALWDGDTPADEQDYEVQPTDDQDDRLVDEDYEADPCSERGGTRRFVSEILDGPISSMWYRRKCEQWWGEHVSEHLIHASHSITVSAEFNVWWHDYKTWLLENRHGN